MTPPFSNCNDQNARAFYSKVFFNVLLNINAVRMGLYPTFLCETDDPRAGLEWRRAIPQVMAEMKRMREHGDD